MGKYVIRRLLQMIPVIIGVTFIIYAAVFALGDPTVGRCGERACPPGYIAAFRAEYNLDKPLVVQYLLYMGNLLQGDLGTNFFGNKVADELLQRLPTTLKLGFMALIIETVIGITAGVLAGIRRGKFIDNLVTVSTLFLISIPIFVIGSVAQLIFGVRLGWFPVTATQGTWYQLIMPAFVLASASLAYIARLMRANLAENLRADYVRTAKAKGLTNRRTVGVHTLAQLADSGGHLHRHRHRGLDGRGRRHRADLQHQRRRQLLVPQHQPEGRHVRGRHGHRPGADLLVHEPHRRRPLRHPGSEDLP